MAEKLQGDRVNQQAMAQTKKGSAGKWDELNTVKNPYQISKPTEIPDQMFTAHLLITVD